MAKCCCGELLTQKEVYEECECKSCRDWFGCQGSPKYRLISGVCPVTRRTTRCSSPGEGCCLRTEERERSERETRKAEREHQWQRQQIEERRLRAAERVAEFRSNWRASSPGKKLDFYGKPKLLVLARRYAIKGRYRMTVGELVRALRPLVAATDFPIR